MSGAAGGDDVEALARKALYDHLSTANWRGEIPDMGKPNPHFALWQITDSILSSSWLADRLRTERAEAWDEGHGTSNGGCVYWPDCAENGDHDNPYRARAAAHATQETSREDTLL